MKWLEIIKMSSPKDRQDEVEKAIGDLMAKSNNQELRSIRVFRNAVVENSLNILLYWNSKTAEPNGSMIGLSLVHLLKELGLTSHSVWIERRPKRFGKGGSDK